MFFNRFPGDKSRSDHEWGSGDTDDNHYHVSYVRLEPRYVQPFSVARPQSKHTVEYCLKIEDLIWEFLYTAGKKVKHAIIYYIASVHVWKLSSWVGKNSEISQITVA